MRVRCPNCGTIYTLPDGARVQDYFCSVCGNPALAPLPALPPQAQGPALPIGGAIGGATLGGAIFGPPGALVGGFIGLLIGAAARNQR